MSLKQVSSPPAIHSQIWHGNYGEVLLEAAPHGALRKTGRAGRRRRGIPGEFVTVV